MSKIILTNYPYDKYNVDDVVDLGEDTNQSLVGQGRAVWYVEPKKPKSQAQIQVAIEKVREAIETKNDTPSQPKNQDKAPVKFLENNLRKQVEENKKSSPKASFWDKLK